jgi:hypothetical protein
MADVARTVEDEGEFEETPEGSAKRFREEFKAAREAWADWHTAAKRADAKYLDDEKGTASAGQKLNLYASGVDLKDAVLDATSPKVDVVRRDNDQDDDVARVAATVLGRVLNFDMEREDEGFPEAISLAKTDWLIAGLGVYWNRLERKTEAVEAQEARVEDGQEIAPPVPATTRTISEDIISEYVFWEDFLVSPCRVFSQARWAAKKSLLSKKTLVKKFGAEDVSLSIGSDPKDPTVPKTPWARAEVWEIHDKENGAVYWYVDNHLRVLVPLELKEMARKDGGIPDPLGLSTFWPFPEPLIDGNTNSKYVPRPAYTRSQDLYTAIDDETSRIGLLRDAVKAAGVYDPTVGEFQDLLKPDAENKMVPAKNYKALADKGGIAACIAWLPLDAIVAALQELRSLRSEDIQLLFQVDGTSDIQRGEATEAGATATEQAIKAKYGSIRGGRAQKRFAMFASDGQRIRAELICKHFDPATIALRANVQGLPPNDQQLVPQAIQLLKTDGSRFRVSVKGESVSLTDFAANKQEALDVLGMIGEFVQVLGPMMQTAGAMAVPYLLQLLQVFISRVKGGDAAEPIIDELVNEAKQMVAQAQAAGPRPDPRMQAEQAKVQTAQVKAGAEQFRAKADVMQTALEMHQSAQEHSQSMQALENEVRADAMKTLVNQPEAT